MLHTSSGQHQRGTARGEDAAVTRDAFATSCMTGSSDGDVTVLTLAIASNRDSSGAAEGHTDCILLLHGKF